MVAELKQAQRSRSAASATEEHGLWEDWTERADAAARDRLLEIYSAHARMIAATFYAKRFNNEIEFGEYHQLACVGMLEAFERFDPTQGVLFRTFAERRIRGAILDGLDVQSEKQQQIAASRRLNVQRYEELKAVHGDPPPAHCAGDQVLKYVAEVGLAFAIGWILEGSGMVARHDALGPVDSYQRIEMRQLRERILEVVKSLPRQECKVIQWHYLQNITFEEIAGMLGLTRGRISQIHRKALSRLKEVLSGPEPCNVHW
ncbi:MAG TPA: sigma-70 family RNA polymerase sigma factor [Ramlibacter sp.]|nr:sigma-70 family RNA polymerase sigma factor [Ramlibacter sp.]